MTGSGYRKLGRTSSQRKALLRNQITQLLYHGKITTTDTRAKEVRKSFDKMVFNTDIAELVNLKCIFVIKDENTNEVLEECSIDIFKED